MDTLRALQAFEAFDPLPSNVCRKLDSTPDLALSTCNRSFDHILEVCRMQPEHPRPCSCSQAAFFAKAVSKTGVWTMEMQNMKT